jgi:hypothetical protein
MQAGFIVRALLASPGDVKEEREIVCDAAADWNVAHSVERETILEIVKGDRHARSSLGNHPQEIINSQLLDRCDFLIAVFWYRLGTPTNKHASGTVHEITEFAERKGHDKVMVFFSGRPLPSDIDTTELAAFREFKTGMSQKGLYIPYEDLADFRNKLNTQLNLGLNNVLKSEEARNLWSQKAVMTERDRLAIEAQRISIEIASGRPVPPPNATSTGSPRMSFKVRLAAFCDHFEHTLNDEKSTSPPKFDHHGDFFETSNATLLSILDEYSGAASPLIFNQLEQTAALIVQAFVGCSDRPTPFKHEGVFSHADRAAHKLRRIVQMLPD